MTVTYCPECGNRVRDLTGHIAFSHDMSARKFQQKYPDADIRVTRCYVCNRDYTYRRLKDVPMTCSSECRHKKIAMATST